MKPKKDFPDDFIWGAATAAYQIEGGNTDGKGPSVWNEFEKRPDAIVDNVNGNITCNHYRLWREDIARMKELGLKAYRFSVSWSRILPDGYGKINHKGADYYKALCDELKNNEIEPYVTLYHWDLPQKLQKDFGGWESMETVKYYAEYASILAETLGAGVKNYFTFNEFLACSDVAYGMGLIAPGLKLPPKRLNQVRHHLLFAHGLGVQAIRAAAPHAKIGIAENPSFMIPVIEDRDNILAAKKAFREENARYLTPIMEGAYPEIYLERTGVNAPVFTDQEMKIINEPLDFIGLNLYYGKYVRHAPEKPEGYFVFEENADSRKNSGIADFHYQPSSMYWGCRLVYELWKPKEIMITEHGKFLEDRPDADGNIYDTPRITAMRDYLSFLARAVKENYPISGYFHWSLMDNLEWHLGFRPRFGLYYVNFQTLERTPKLSAKWYRELIRTGRIV